VRIQLPLALWVLTVLALRQGRTVLAVHVHQNRGGQFIDVGIVDVIEPGQAR
jgi:hypothetical protein